MAGIMIPITMGVGKQAALRDNRADERYAQDQELNAMRMTGLQMQQKRDKMAMDEATEEAPIRKMKRDAEKISELAKFGAMNLDRVSDQDVPAYVAKVMSEMPAFGNVEVRGNQLFEGQKTIPMGRAEAEKLLSTFANPETALKLKMEESQYVDSKGNVTTTTAANAQRQGLSRATDVKAGYDLGKAGVESKYAEQDARLGLAVKQANIDQSRAAMARSQQEKMAAYTDGKTVQTMTPEDARARGWRLASDAKAERELGGGGGYDFSKQSPDAAADYVFEATMQDGRYQPVNYVDVETGARSQKWFAPDGTEATPEVVEKARAVSRDAVGLLSNGNARDPQDAYSKAKAYREDMDMAQKFASKAQQAVAEKRAIVLPSGESKVFTDPQEAFNAIVSIHRQRKGEMENAKKAGMAAMNGQQQGAPQGQTGLQRQPTPATGDPGYGQRNDGTRKGRGFLGEIPTADGQGVMTELGAGVNIDGKEVEIPLLVPTLTQEEISALASGQRATPVIMQKAVDHAKLRLAQGKSPFAQDGEQIQR